MSDSRASAPTARSRLRVRRGDESGAALVEFALVVGIFVFVLYGLISFGMILAQKQRITNAASEAARSAVGAVSPAAARATAEARVDALLGSAGAYGTRVVTTQTCGSGISNPTPPPPACVKVKITYNYQAHPIVPPAPGLGVITPNSFESSAEVQYQ